MNALTLLNNFVEDLRNIEDLVLYTNTDEIDTAFIFECNEVFTLAFIEGVISIDVEIINGEPDIKMILKSDDIVKYPNVLVQLANLKDKYADL